MALGFRHFVLGLVVIISSIVGMVLVGTMPCNQVKVPICFSNTIL